MQSNHPIHVVCKVAGTCMMSLCRSSTLSPKQLDLCSTILQHSLFIYYYLVSTSLNGKLQILKNNSLQIAHFAALHPVFGTNIFSFFRHSNFFSRSATSIISSFSRHFNSFFHFHLHVSHDHTAIFILSF